MERIAHDHFACSIAVARYDDVAHVVAAERFDVAVLDDPLDDEHLLRIGGAVRETGCGLVICSTRTLRQASAVACLGCPVIFKPFAEKGFCRAIEMAAELSRINR